MGLFANKDCEFEWLSWNWADDAAVTAPAALVAEAAASPWLVLFRRSYPGRGGVFEAPPPALRRVIELFPERSFVSFLTLDFFYSRIMSEFFVFLTYSITELIVSVSPVVQDPTPLAATVAAAATTPDFRFFASSPSTWPIEWEWLAPARFAAVYHDERVLDERFQVLEVVELLSDHAHTGITDLIVFSKSSLFLSMNRVELRVYRSNGLIKQGARKLDELPRMHVVLLQLLVRNPLRLWRWCSWVAGRGLSALHKRGEK